jgi:mutator protein MutT
MPGVPHVEGLPQLSLQPGRPLVKTTIVTAAVIERDGRFLVTRRQDGVHLAGAWEFPGGKCDPGETLEACMVRELREELAVSAVVGEEIFATTHAYPDRTVELHFLQCTLRGEPVPQQGQSMQWVARHQLTALEFPPADEELIRLLANAD